ncbi:MAG: hypothetical protein JWO62_449 [Acidimicrobiaceae bacterium]|jgi:hypothetical protein|nr:hypothetical protein [Acidimicrobiaceae bacterium]
MSVTSIALPGSTTRSLQPKLPRSRGSVKWRSRHRSGMFLAVTSAILLASFGSSSASSVRTAHAGTATTRGKIKADWIAFFAGSTPARRKIALLQNGASFARIIDGQASSPLAKSVAATVSKVTLTSPTRATVRYSLTLGGQPALTNQSGVSVLQGGTWKVGAKSFCALLALEQVKAAACPTS